MLNAPKLKILGVGRNVEKYLPNYFSSLFHQTYQNFEVLIILDQPTDNSASLVTALRYNSSMSIRLLINSERKMQPRNFFEGVPALCKDDEDICCIYDLDDRLANDAFATVASCYIKTNCLLTYGTYHRDGRPNNDLEFQNYVPTGENFRQQPWFASHLKTFKYKLFKNIKEEDFKYDDKETWFQRTGNQCIMLPMLEMAGLDRIQRIEKVIYLLNGDVKPYSEKYPAVANGKHVHNIVRSRQPYKRLS